jgi:hypothetical protein
VDDGGAVEDEVWLVDFGGGAPIVNSVWSWFAWGASNISFVGASHDLAPFFIPQQAHRFEFLSPEYTTSALPWSSVSCQSIPRQ